MSSLEEVCSDSKGCQVLPLVRREPALVPYPPWLKRTRSGANEHPQDLNGHSLGAFNGSAGDGMDTGPVLALEPPEHDLAWQLQSVAKPASPP